MNNVIVKEKNVIENLIYEVRGKASDARFRFS